ncbi:hypothetical protein LTR09_001327 [Extremus antarcticus]|uniref:Cytochrome P450 n=1 Tax=Extremus antarcticus TaxID=702011 RepID=A0AAJ0LWS7_9PEZI|nr:hypothetical protein LTR09_001327 [Extremus antarcticus]
MPSYIVLAIVGLCVTYAVHTYQCSARNLAAAKASGLPYIKTPVYAFNRLWLLTHPLWIKVLRQLPHDWVDPWLSFTKPDFAWEKLYDPFEKFGCDCFLIVSPGGNTLVVADPEAISQITRRRDDFPKPVHFYSGIDQFGKNVVSAEGGYWRHHRKITSPPFNERNNHMVWEESLAQGQSMMSGWLSPNDTATGPLKDIAAQAMRLSLHVISCSGFGVRLQWPHEQAESDIPEGHSLSYKDALSTLLENLIVVMLTPKWFLRNSPFKLQKVAHTSYVEWGKYMKEMYTEKRSEIESGESSGGMDLMGALVKGAGVTAKSSDDDSNHDPEKASETTKTQLFTEDEILGNAFVFILAGHETAANTIHFSILLLAMHWGSQMHLQDDLDAVLGDKSVSEWDYDHDMPKLFGNMCGAVMCEQLRLIPPVVGIPKSTLKGLPQGLTLGGKQITVPGGCTITLDTVALHRNPKYWPHTSREDLCEFRPERWLLDSSKSNTNTDDNTYAEEEDLDFDGPDKRPDTAASLFRPPKSAYVPFSEGHRSCLGRRFAQVEILAVLAVIFKTWSVELDVSDFMSDEEVETASEEQKREAWNKADARARDLLRNGMMTIITIQMRKDKVPMRFVKRGHERFKFG